MKLVSCYPYGFSLIWEIETNLYLLQLQAEYLCALKSYICSSIKIIKIWLSP